MSYSQRGTGSFWGDVYFSYGMGVLFHFQPSLQIIPPNPRRSSLVGGLDKSRGTAQPYLQRRRRCFVV